MTDEQFNNWQWILSRAESQEEHDVLWEQYQEEMKQDPFYD